MSFKKTRKKIYISVDKEDYYSAKEACYFFANKAICGIRNCSLDELIKNDSAINTQKANALALCKVFDSDEDELSFELERECNKALDERIKTELYKLNCRVDTFLSEKKGEAE